MHPLKIRLGVSVLLVLAASTSGCGLKKVRAENTPEAQAQTPVGPVGPAAPGGVTSADMGPPLPPAVTQSNIPAPEAPVGPQPGPGYIPPKDGFVLVLGPGLARGLAYLGVLREMEEHQLSVNAVVGVEIGAVIAGIWGSSNMNNLEWEMYKFKRETLLDYPLLGFRNNVAEGKKLYAFLNEALKVANLQQTKVPVLIASSSSENGTNNIVVESNGPAKDIIRGAMGIPGIIKPFVVDNKERTSASLDTPFPVAQAKALGVGKIVCVDVIGRGDNFTAKEPVEQHLAALMRSISALARQQEKECDVVLSVSTEGISYLNFDAKADLIYKGRAAVKKWLEQIK
jgi:NTE family protein